MKKEEKSNVRYMDRDRFSCFNNCLSRQGFSHFIYIASLILNWNLEVVPSWKVKHLAEQGSLRAWDDA